MPKPKTDFDTVSSYFASQGYNLLESCYSNAHSKMNVMCPFGHEFSIVWHSFKNGTRCSTCKGNAKINPLTVKEYFADQGCELLEDYVRSGQPMLYRCVCGRESKISWSMFKTGRRCKGCGYNKYKGENHPRWNPDRDQVAFNYLLAQKSHDALKTCLRYLSKKKAVKTFDLLGYTSAEIEPHLESFPQWKDLKDSAWSLDHVFPIKAFLDAGIYDLRLMNCLANLQPMLLSENCSKNDSYCRESFFKWLKETCGSI